MVIKAYIIIIHNLIICNRDKLMGEIYRSSAEKDQYYWYGIVKHLFIETYEMFTYT